MINLLPPDVKDSYRYARRNRSLLHWIVAGVVAIVGAIILSGGGYMYLNQAANSTKQQIAASNQQLASEHLTDVQKQVRTISSNLKLVVKVLSQEILFSKLLKQLASVTPNNVVLTDLSISQTQGGVDITAETSSYNAATQLQVNLADPKNQIFSEADIVSINCKSGTDASTSAYPCTASIRALFAKDNPFLFTNNAPQLGGNS